MNNDFVLIETTLQEFSKVEAGLAELRAKYKGVAYAVATPVGMRDAVAARVSIRTKRIEVEKARKAGKAPVLALGKKIDEQAKYITAELEALENPIDEQIKAEETRKEAERQAKIAAEAKRVAAHHEGIAGIANNLQTATGENSETIEEIINTLKSAWLDSGFEEFEEFEELARTTLGDTIAKLSEMQARVFAQEQAQKASEEQANKERLELEAQRKNAEALRLAQQAELDKQRAELEALRVEQERKDREARIAREIEEAAARQRMEAEQKAHQEKIASEKAELVRQQAELAKAKEEEAAKARAAELAHIEKLALEEQRKIEAMEPVERLLMYCDQVVEIMDVWESPVGLVENFTAAIAAVRGTK